MAFSPDPNVLLGAAYAADATNMTLALADFPQISAAEADEETGDSRKVIFGLVEAIAGRYAALAATDLPTKMRVTTSSSAPNANGVFSKTFTFSFDLAVGSVEVENEA